MGKGIVYCRDCGKSLREDDFARHRAHMLDDVPYCTACKPLDRTPPTGSIRKISGTRQPRVPSRILPAVPAPRPPNRLPLVLGGAGGGVLALVVLIAVLASGGRKEEAPPPAPPKAEDPPALVALERFAAGTTDPEAVLLRVDEARAALRGTPYEARLRKVEARAIELRSKRGSEKSGQLDGFLASIRTIMAEDAGFRRKAEVEGMIRSAAGIAGAREGEVRKLELDYEAAFGKAAGAACAAARDEALALAAREDYAAAAERLDQVPSAFLASPAGRQLPDLRRRYRAKHEELEKAARAWIEGERLAVLEKKGEAHAQDMKPFKGAWSEGAQLWWRNASKGDVLRLEFPSAVAGKRKLHLAMSVAPDYGVFRISVNGTVVLEQVDLYGPKVASLPETSVEAVLRKGPNELKVEITGTNPQAKPANFMFGLDYLRLE
jgi:hypothetical protein